MMRCSDGALNKGTKATYHVEVKLLLVGTLEVNVTG